MQYMEFIDFFKESYSNWSQVAKPLLQEIEQVSKRSDYNHYEFTLYAVCDLAMRFMKENESICYAGKYDPELIAKLLKHHQGVKSHLIYPISDYDSTGNSFEKMVDIFDKEGVLSQISIYDQHPQFVYQSWREDEDNIPTIGIYICDLSNDYRTTLLSLQLAIPFFSDSALILLCNSNLHSVRQACIDYLSLNHNLEVVIDLRYGISGYTNQWKGINMISFDKSKVATQRLLNYPSYVQDANAQRIIFKEDGLPRIEANFLQINHFFSKQQEQSILKFCMDNENLFVPTGTINNETPTYDASRHSIFIDLSLYQSRFPDLVQLIKQKIISFLPLVLPKLGFAPFLINNIEIQITAHNDGGFYLLHTDASRCNDRIITYVYYFYNEPQQFSGGDLRIYDTQIGVDQDFIHGDCYVIPPINGSIVFFDSRCLHEVMPVNCISKRFEDSRFTINGWIHAEHNT